MDIQGPYSASQLPSPLLPPQASVSKLLELLPAHTSTWLSVTNSQQALYNLALPAFLTTSPCTGPSSLHHHPQHTGPQPPMLIFDVLAALNADSPATRPCLHRCSDVELNKGASGKNVHIPDTH